MKKKTIITILLLLLLAAAAGIAAFAWSRSRSAGQDGSAGQQTPSQAVEEDAADWEGEKPVYEGQQEESDNISIPGFDVMNLKAGETAQSVNLYNPEQNDCYFKISLLLSDGTRLWESNLLAPGKALYEITLDEPLEAGTYEDAVLKYECFTYDEAQSPLNGAEIKLDIQVLE